MRTCWVDDVQLRLLAICASRPARPPAHAGRHAGRQLDQSEHYAIPLYILPLHSQWKVEFLIARAEPIKRLATAVCSRCARLHKGPTSVVNLDVEVAVAAAMGAAVAVHRYGHLEGNRTVLFVAGWSTGVVVDWSVFDARATPQRQAFLRSPSNC